MYRSKSYSDIQPFPPDWLDSFDVETLERLAIMTIDGGLSDSEALTMLVLTEADNSIQTARGEKGMESSGGAAVK